MDGTYYMHINEGAFILEESRKNGNNMGFIVNSL